MTVSSPKNEFIVSATNQRTDRWGGSYRNRIQFPIEIVRCATVREPDGLAMSSRNVRLTPAERTAYDAEWGEFCREMDIARRGRNVDAWLN